MVKAVFLEALPATILLATEAGLAGFGVVWLVVSPFASASVWLPASLITAGVLAVWAFAVLIQRAIRTSERDAAFVRECANSPDERS